MRFRLSFFAAMAGSTAIVSPAFAQQGLPEEPTSDPVEIGVDDGIADQEAIIVTGTRFQPRTATQSAVPVDAISRESLQQGGRVDLLDQLRTQVPSFSFPRPLGSGVGDYILQPSLRGLGPGELLVLVNGKRRHTTADLNASNGIGRGDVAVDLNAIPTLALSQAEVLRDGAAAQYGSDAISGVINLILDRSVGTRAMATYGITERGDGEYYEASVSSGIDLGNDAVLRLTASYLDREGTNRSDPDTRQQYFGTDAVGQPTAISGNFGSGTGLTPSNGTLDPREATFDRNVFRFGDQPFTNAQFFANFVAPASDTVEVYAFGGYNRLEGDIEYFFRRPGQNETIRAFYPDGFRPRLDSRIENFSAAFGLRGEDLAGFGWDLSTVYGVNTQDLFYENSANVSLGLDSPTRFYRLGADFYQWTSNLDLTRDIFIGDGSPVQLAFGAEYREEDYRLFSGDIDGFRNGGVPILDGPSAGSPAPIGAQPGPTAGPDDRASIGRNSKAVYAEVQKVFFDRLLLQGAVRYEDFSDFGNTTNYKAAGRFEIGGGLAVRASYNTAFRAPALAQSGYNASNTLILNGQQAVVRVAAVGSPAARLAGAQPLRPEKSENISAGVVFESGAFSATVDAYRIDLNDRIAISSTFQDQRITDFLAANGQAGFGAISFITNAVDTITEGIDVVMNYRHQFADSSELTATLAGNYNTTEFDRIADTPAPLAALGVTTPLFDLTQQLRFSDSLPRSKVTLDLNYISGPLSIGVQNTRFGEVSTVALTNRTPAQIVALTPGYDVELVPVAGSANSDIIQTFGAKILTDVQLGYALTPALRLTAGVRNVFDVYPDENIRSSVESVAEGTNGADASGTQPYNAISPFGFNGRTYFVRLGLDF
ncbi:TonB-dependent receptor plug domain-containing protein [Qipengyuania qiaonensis]|uniref:TonB-dependent receptor n=1 Tax=Qipengyuania qiaonensis TaxID=2867240 RepID=A0ABS7JAJ7_9SPHN|nr:TonB-dependent receptor [Qipengyuania qiaonensis]MBX7483331.1 TonB-dependent receptor [Qipengyuania qiaonensis]